MFRTIKELLIRVSLILSHSVFVYTLEKFDKEMHLIRHVFDEPVLRDESGKPVPKMDISTKLPFTDGNHEF